MSVSGKGHSYSACQIETFSEVVYFFHTSDLSRCEICHYWYAEKNSQLSTFKVNVNWNLLVDVNLCDDFRPMDMSMA